MLLNGVNCAVWIAIQRSLLPRPQALNNTLLSHLSKMGENRFICILPP